MTNDRQGLVDRYYALMAGTVDQDAVATLYARDALVIRFDETSVGLEAITAFLTGVKTRNQPYRLHSIDQLTHVGDVVMWDAVVDTSNGLLETTEVFVLDTDGRINRHIPGVRGYWGM